LVWAASKRFRAEKGTPIPLALGSPSCLWRSVAEEALGAVEQPTRGLFFSKNFSAINSVVRAGLAATILPASMVAADMQILDEKVGMPPLPSTRMGLIRASGRPSEETKALAEAIRATLSPVAARVAA
jgi:DNA-binding transcriptional LysR family regulator